MRRAQKLAKDIVEVSMYSSQYPEDRALVPEYFTQTDDLDRSILDISKYYGSRKLPLIGDILDRLYHASNADYFIYTNVDIGLRPDFYTAVAEIIRSGYDAFSITHRTILSPYSRIDELPMIDREDGMQSTGHDCFVFRRDKYQHYRLKNICVGVPPIGRIMLCNCVAFAASFNTFRDKHLTFHLGLEGAWKKKVDNAELSNSFRGLPIVRALRRENRNPAVDAELAEQQRIMAVGLRRKVYRRMRAGLRTRVL